MAGNHESGAGKDKGKFYIASLAREFTEQAINLLKSAVNNSNLKMRDRITAAEILLDRGWGKAPQEIRMGNIEGEEGVKFVVEIVDTGKPTDGSAGKIAGTDHQDPGAQRDDDAAPVAGISGADSTAAAGGA